MKEFFLTDEQIRDLIDEPKQIDCSAVSILRNMKSRGGRASSHFYHSHRFPRVNGEGVWLIYLRRNKLNPLDFSCGLGFLPQGRNQAFMLRRYNGKSHEHTNRLEKQPPFYDFHIHQATERYQTSSYGDEHYATITDGYVDLAGAFKCLMDDCRIVDDSDEAKQTELFG